MEVDCEDQAEVGRLWDATTSSGAPAQCGWLKDRYGVSWQIVPKVPTRMLADPDAAEAGRVMTAMLEMVKIRIGALIGFFSDFRRWSRRDGSGHLAAAPGGAPDFDHGFV